MRTCKPAHFITPLTFDCRVATILVMKKFRGLSRTLHLDFQDFPGPGGVHVTLLIAYIADRQTGVGV